MNAKKQTQQLIELYEEGQRFVVFDVETAGPNIVEIGAVEAGKDYAGKFRNFQQILEFRPKSWRPYRRELMIHKIPTREIENGRPRLEVFREFVEFAEGAVLICHTSFDIRMFLSNIREHPELSGAEELPLWHEYLDSCRLAREICPHLVSFALKNLASHFRITNPQAHRALADAWTTKRVVAGLLRHYYHTVTTGP